MRILLISPANLKEMSMGQPKYFTDNMAIFPPLSLLSLSSYLNQQSSHVAKILDMAIENTSENDLIHAIEEFEPDVIGTTCMLHNWYAIVHILRLLKTKFPHIITVVGGHHTSEFPQETLQHDTIDFMVLGTGQTPLKELLDKLENGSKDFSNIKGLFPRNSNKRNFQDEKIRHNPDKYPFPDRSCVPYKKYRSAITQKFPSTVMISSDGCPFHCNFCCTSNMKNILIRDPIKVVDEMEACVKLGIKEIMFQDELFTINKERVYKICKEIIDRKLEVAWNFKSRIDLIDEGWLPLAKRAGCNNIHFGIENGNDEILEKMNKGITVSMVKNTFSLLKRHSIPGSASFMLAYPGETMAQIHNTINFAVTLKLSYVQFTITCDFPGTNIYLEKLSAGRYKEDIWKKFVLNPVQSFTPPYSSDLFTPEELEKIMHQAYRKFYFRFGYVKKRLFSIKSPQQFLNQAKIAANFLKAAPRIKVV